MNTVKYWLSIIFVMPLYVLVALCDNLYVNNRQAIRWTVGEVKSTWQSNKRYYGK